MKPSIMLPYLRMIFLMSALFYQGITLCQSPHSLAKLLDSTRKERNDSARLVLDDQFYQKLIDTLKSPDFQLSSTNGLKIGRTTSSDGKMIFFNWNIQQNDGQNLYNGIIFLPQNHKVIPLSRKIPTAKLKADSVYIPNDWPGGLYYKIIAPKKKEMNYYLLLGWDRFNRQTSRKTIEVVSFVNDSAVVFGKEVFKTKDGRASRIILEYAATANMTLNYSKQNLRLTGVRKSQSHVNDSIIVIDRLMPLNATLEGERWAYVPAGNIYDGYIYFKGYWTFVEGINARNPTIKREDRRKEKKPDLDLLPER